MRFFRRGVSEILVIPTIGNPNSPTRIEIDGGTNISVDIAEIGGFQLSNSPIAVPNLADTFTGQINGEDTVSDSSITFYDHQADADQTIRPLLAKGITTYLGLLPYGDVPAARMEVWHVRSTGVNGEWTVGNDPARFVIGFAVLSRPNQEVDIPA